MTQKDGLSYETRMIVVLGFMFGIVFFDRNAMAFLGPFVARDLHLNSTQVGMLGSALSFTWALSGLLVSALSDATGKRKAILVVAIVIFSLSSLLSGLAATFSVLLLSRLLMGLSEGGILPICQSLLVAESSEKRRGLNMGVMQNVGSNFFGSFLAPIVRRENGTELSNIKRLVEARTHATLAPEVGAYDAPSGGGASPAL